MAANARRVSTSTERKQSAFTVLAAFARTLCAVALSAALAFAGAHAQRWLSGGAPFAIREIHFTGLQRAGEADLLARSGLRSGDNILAADLAAAARGIAQHPWVASVQLARRLPGAIEVRVREHEPAALVDLGGLYATDAQGRLFKRVTRADAIDLPLVTGLQRTAWDADRPAAQARLSAALRLLAEWRRQGLPLSRLSEVRIDADGGLTLFEQQPDSVLEVRVGASDFATRLSRLSHIHGALARRGERPVRIDLDLIKPGSGSWAAAQVGEH